MKHYTSLLCLFLLCAGLQIANAQDSTATRSGHSMHKPGAGEFGVGIRAIGLKGLIWENNFIGQSIQFRKVQSPTLVLRGDLTLEFTNEKTSNKDVFSTGGFAYTENRQRDFTIGIAPGVERHFEGSKRLDPYIGAALPLAFIGRSQTTNIDDFEAADGDYAKQTVERSTPGGFGFGLDGLVGVNYFAFNRLSIGIEYRFGFSFVNVGGEEKTKTTVKEVQNGGPEMTTTTETSGDESSESVTFFGNKGVLGLNLIFYFGSKN
jgi:hypothetical protein